MINNCQRRNWQWLILLLGCLAAPAAQAQIIDDSTRVVYGPKTTRLVYEREVLRDSTKGVLLDTALTRLPQVRYWVHDSAFQQDLGALGTASRPLLYQANTELGARFGRNVFDRYAHNASTIPYYDSRSPYSFFRVLQSGAGEQVFELSYSRSFKENFSIGASYERIASNKISAAATTRDGLVEHSNLLLFGRYQTADGRYHLVFNLSNARHRGIEQGGIRPDAGEDELNELFDYERQSVYLSQAQNIENRDELRFTHTYRLLGRGVTAFHTFDARRQYNSYSDNAFARDAARRLLVYPDAYRSFTNTLDRAEFRQVENTAGLLGRTSAVEYRLYARYRAASLLEKSLVPGAAATGARLVSVARNNIGFHQIFLGGTAAFNYRKIYAVEAAGEFKGLDEYWLRGSIRTGPLSAEVLRSVYAPTLTQQYFVGNHYRWNYTGVPYARAPEIGVPDSASRSAFANTLADHLSVRLDQPLPFLQNHRLELRASFVNLVDLVYYGLDGRPTQASTAKQLLIGFARHRASVGKLFFDNQLTYTRGGNVEGVRIPALVGLSRAYYQSYILGGALLSQVGAEVYYQTHYRGWNYSPSTQQFYLQDDFTIRSYALADVFFAADIKAVNVFLKVAYVNQNIGHPGYFAAPYYSGYPRRFIFGIKWNFFN